MTPHQTEAFMSEGGNVACLANIRLPCKEAWQGKTLQLTLPHREWRKK